MIKKIYNKNGKEKLINKPISEKKLAAIEKLKEMNRKRAEERQKIKMEEINKKNAEEEKTRVNEYLKMLVDDKLKDVMTKKKRNIRRKPTKIINTEEEPKQEPNQKIIKKPEFIKPEFIKPEFIKPEEPKSKYKIIR
jgi:hypothetical protein